MGKLFKARSLTEECPDCHLDGKDGFYLLDFESQIYFTIKIIKQCFFMYFMIFVVKKKQIHLVPTGIELIINTESRNYITPYQNF